MEILNEIVLYVYLGVFLVMTIFLFSSAIYDNRKEKDIEEKREFYFRQKATGEGLKKRGDSIILGCIIWMSIAGWKIKRERIKSRIYERTFYIS